MDDQAGDTQATGGSSKPLGGLTGWIGGATALVIAITGLLKAFGGDEPAKPAAAAVEAAATTDEAATDDSAAADEMPLYLVAGDWTLDFKDGLWTMTDDEGTTTRYEQLSRDATTTAAIDREAKAYLRWPTPGGMVTRSVDGQVSWTDEGEYYPPEPEAPAEAPAAN